MTQQPRVVLPRSRRNSVSCSSAVVKKSTIVQELPTTTTTTTTTTTEDDEEQTNSMMNNNNSTFSLPQDWLEKLFNAMVLITCFGYALYQLLDIDHGMTRGWSQSEIAMRIPLDNWNLYESSLSEHPYMTKTTINVIIYLLGDWLSQTLLTPQKGVLDFDAKRTFRNGFIGLCFGPLVAMYYEWSDYILPVEAGLWNRMEKICMDQTLYLSVKCSLYIFAVGVLGGEEPKQVVTNVKERIGPIMFTAWKFWPLVHCITYGVIPARHRILWVNSVDLVWNAILATAARNDPVVQEEEQEEEITVAVTKPVEADEIAPVVDDHKLVPKDQETPVLVSMEEEEENTALVAAITTNLVSNSTIVKDKL